MTTPSRLPGTLSPGGHPGGPLGEASDARTAGQPAVLFRRLLGRALRSARNRQRRTLRQVSAAAGVSLGYLSEIERGRKEASSELLAAICTALGVRLADLLAEAVDELAGLEPLPEPLPEQIGVLIQPDAPRIAAGTSVRAAA